MDEILRCPSCGQANRVSELKPGQKAVCGRCKATLEPRNTAAVSILTDATFEHEIGRGDPIVVDFWAGWCGPCAMIGPVIEQLATERTDVRFAKLNVDENPRTSAAFRVQGIPLLIFFKGGQERGRVTGAVPRVSIESAITRYLG